MGRGCERGRGAHGVPGSAWDRRLGCWGPCRYREVVLGWEEGVPGGMEGMLGGMEGMLGGLEGMLGGLEGMLVGMEGVQEFSLSTSSSRSLSTCSILSPCWTVV